MWTTWLVENAQGRTVRILIDGELRPRACPAAVGSQFELLEPHVEGTVADVIGTFCGVDLQSEQDFERWMRGALAQGAVRREGAVAVDVYIDLPLPPELQALRGQQRERAAAAYAAAIRRRIADALVLEEEDVHVLVDEVLQQPHVDIDARSDPQSDYDYAAYARPIFERWARQQLEDLHEEAEEALRTVQS